MKIKSAAIGAVALATAVAMPAHAELSEGDIEVAASITIQMPDEGEDTSFFQGSYGVMMTDNAQLEAGLFLAESGGLSFGQVTIGGEYYFAPKAELLPYAGGGYSLAIGDFDDTDFFNIRGGVKTFVNERTTVFAELIKLEPVDSDFDDAGSTQLLLGFSVLF